MLQRHALALTVVIATEAFLLPAGAHADAKDEAAIRAMYPRLSAMFNKKDIKGIMALATDDFKSKEPGQPPMGAKQMEQMMAMQFAAMKSMNAVMKPDRVTIKDDRATVMSTFRMKATIVDKQGQMGPKGATHVVSDFGTMRDMWRKTKAGWKVYYIETLKNNPMMDGKPFQMGAPPPSAGGKKKK